MRKRAVVSLVAVAAAGMLVWFAAYRPGAGHPRASRPGTAPGSLQIGSSDVAGSRKAEKATDDAVRAAVGGGSERDRLVSGKRVSQLSAAIAADEVVMKKASDDMYEKLSRAAREMPAYHVKEGDLKRELIARYGGVTSDRVADMVKEAAALEEEFWKEGDFDNKDSFDCIYQARALLELCLEASPDDEVALRRLCDVIQAGWPRTLAADLNGDKGFAWEVYVQRPADLYIPMHRLWAKHLSQKADLSEEDLRYARDLTIETMVYPKAATMLGDDEFRKRTPNPSEELSRLIHDGVPVSEQEAVAKWALAGIQRSPALSSHKSFFEQFLEFAEGKRRLPPSSVFSYDCRNDISPVERMRYSAGRGSSFVGPQDRAQYLQPLSGPK